MARRVSVSDAADVSAFHMEYDRHTAMRAQIPVTVNDLYRKQLMLRSLIQTGNFQMVGFLCRPVDFPGCLLSVSVADRTKLAGLIAKLP